MLSSQKGAKVEGMIQVSYTVMCQKDVSKQITLLELLSNEKVEKVIKAEFAKGLRNLLLSSSEDTDIFFKTQKEVFTFVVRKNDFADILELAEEDAKKHKRTKKDCEGVELVDIVTVD